MARRVELAYKRHRRAGAVKLWASPDSSDTDFTAKLIDVYPTNPGFPGGVGLNIAASTVRARYRGGPGAAQLLKPG